MKKQKIYVKMLLDWGAWHGFELKKGKIYCGYTTSTHGYIMGVRYAWHMAHPFEPISNIEKLLILGGKIKPETLP